MKRKTIRQYGLLIIFAGFSFAFSSCTHKMYEAPHYGAEYQFDNGMRSPKHHSRLFDKKMQKDDPQLQH